ncbi:GTPase Era, mitochondrial [Gadus morhua]|uniref:GTPase Era, mitochondrial n=1 Tax=Gadus morhua TaxID=8049 RepID=A0A8C5FQP0_GADMO|nr:GTPase Era, mitochondrial-like [Gadus morhua]
MALRACSWAVRNSVCASRLSVLSGRHEHALLFLRTGIAAHSRRTNGLSFTPVCFITSDAFLNRLAKGKVAEQDDSGYHHPTSVPPHHGEQLSLLMREPDQPETSRVLKVAIVGSPNAGKSTLSNQLLGRKVFAVSKKVHTTRSKTLGVLTEDDTQIILLDTPGLTTASKVKRHNLESSLLSDPWSTVKEADLMLVMVDVADKWACEKLDLEVLKVLAKHPEVPAVLVLNKTDLVKNKVKLLDVTAHLTCGVVNGQKLQVRRVVRPRRAAAGTPAEAAPPPPAESAPRDTPQGESPSVGSDASPAGTPSQEPLSQEPLSQGPLSQEPLSQGPLSQEPLSQEPLSQEPLTQEPLSQEPLSQGPLSQGPLTQGPLSQEPLSQGPLSQGPLSQGPLSQEPLGPLKSRQGWPHFRDVFMVSSVDQEDVDALKRYLVVEAKAGPWHYHSEVLTDQTPEEVCANIVREKLLENLRQEVPYTMTQSIEFWSENENGELDIAVKLYVKKEAHMKMVIGTAGQMVARIAREAGQDMSNIFLREVRLRLSVKLKN